MGRFAILGTGNIGSGFVDLWDKDHDLILYDRSQERAQALAAGRRARVAASAREAVKEAEKVVVAVKPQDLEELAGELSHCLHRTQQVLSVVSGFSIERLGELFPKAQSVRIVPNLAFKVGCGVMVVERSEDLSQSQREQLVQLFLPNRTLWADSEAVDRYLALSASGLAFCTHFIEALAEAGLHIGIRFDDALTTTLQVMRGAISLLESGLSADALRHMICTPAGTTVAGLLELEKGALKSSVIEAVRASYRRAKELGEE